MKIEQTLSIIKPDAIFRNIIGYIYTRIENSGLKIIASRMLHLFKNEIKKFYIQHKTKHFFKNLINFMSSGSVIVQILEGKNAVTKYRNLVGNTNPKIAKIGTIRKDFAHSINLNTIHASDNIKNAKKEVFFFSKILNIYSR